LFAGIRYKLTAIAFLLFIAVFNLATLSTFGEKVVGRLRGIPAAAGEVTITPFPAEELRRQRLIEGAPPTRATLARKLIVKRDFIDGQITKRFPYKDAFIDLFGFCQLAMGKRYIDDVEVGRIYRDPRTRYLYSAKNFLVKSVTNQPEGPLLVQHRLLDLSRTLEQNGIPLLFIMAPNKLPAPNSPSEQTADELLSFAAKQRIAALDLRKELHITEANKERFFYRTDHHWTVQTAFQAYRKIFARLQRDYHFDFDGAYADIDNFTARTFPHKFLGSYGRRVGRYYAGRDDITLLTPKFPTSYSSWKLNLRNQQVTREGDFTEVIFDGKDPEKIAIDYIIYLNGDWPAMKITNHLQKKYKLLVIKDSFAPPVIAFLSMNVHEINVVDMRQYRFKQSVEEYILDYKPDLVLILYNKDMLSSGAFAFSE